MKYYPMLALALPLVNALVGDLPLFLLEYVAQVEEVNGRSKSKQKSDVKSPFLYFYSRFLLLLTLRYAQASISVM